MEVADVTAAQCLHETSERMRARAAEAGSPGGGGGGEDGALEVLGRVRPLSTVLQPLVDKATDGLARMGKIVGGSTPPSDAGPESVAVFADTREGCSADVLSPLAEIAETLRGRTALLEEMRAEGEEDEERRARVRAGEDGRRPRVEELGDPDGREGRPPEGHGRRGRVLPGAQEARGRPGQGRGGVDAAVADAARARDGLVRLAGRGDGDVARRCLVDLPEGKAELCRDLLRGQGQVLRRIEAGLTRTRAGLDGLLAGSVDKENWRL
ncbi:hypothetical protein THAOC_17728 [Thalassiosira oceanica]|uniref:Uncharacterized protein n=1 Tax=Thalassiosira oceanica TaxID=159749 RepID=K0SLC9_THAOC|nr:hypothetical protein THAOC_17728 [Thalassiosira oceanica]|eukprot:EJK61731.1 hypothetical protein THAOC_17728 [Thalassiosira oceanica]